VANRSAAASTVTPINSQVSIDTLLARWGVASAATATEPFGAVSMRADCRRAVIVRRLSGHSGIFKDPRALFGGAAALLIAAVVVLVIALASAGSKGSDARSAPPAGTTGPRTAPLESIFEADTQLEADPVGTLKLMRRLGVDRVRVFMPWGAIGSRPPITPDPLSRTRPRFDATDPAAYEASGWAVFDAIDRAAAQQGIGIDMTIGPPGPVWATVPGAPQPGPPGVWKLSGSEFGQFVHAVGARYSGAYPDPQNPGHKLPRIDFWGIWNEPNLGINLAPQAVHRGTLEVSPMLYRRMLDSAWSALQASGHGHDTILFGELAPDGNTIPPEPGNYDMMAPLRFLRALYCVGSSYEPLRGAAATARGCPATASASSRFVAENPGLFHATGVADHPYPQGQPPTELTPDEPDYADFAALGNLERTLDRLQQTYGSSTHFPIYDTEFGYWTDPPSNRARADSPNTAAAYLNEAEYLSWLDPRVRSYDQYLLQDGSTGTFPSGLEFASGAPKPSYAAFRMPVYLPKMTASKGVQLVVWGCVRPAHYVSLAQRKPVEIQFRPVGGGAFKTVGTVTVTDPRGYFEVRQSFPRSGSVRLRWSYPDGTTIFSRLVAITVR
jgi:hypothetical protein